ncbi:MAG TPA: hypothetical protein VKZ76_02205 [Edaphocola sp.]|nr:hypothetical protein [Edaphocola sp.]
MRKLVITVLCLLASFGAWSQVRYSSGGAASKPKEKGFDPQKIVVGGGLGAGLGSGVLAFSLSPMVGYEFAPNFLAGVSLSYQYLRIKEANEVMNTTTGRVEVYPAVQQMFSPGLWARYHMFNSFFAQVHFEYHMVSERHTEPALYVGGSGVEKVKTSYGMPTLLVGAGYRLPITNRVGMYLGVYYDVLQHATEKTITDSRNRPFTVSSPYYGRLNPVIGVGIGL